MDIRLFITALARHKWIAVTGLLLAILFAVFSQVRVDPFGSPHFTYRKDVVWGSRVELQITQPGFYEGRVVGNAGGRPLLELAPLYARLAVSDPVRVEMRKDGPVAGAVVANAVVDENGSGLPLIEVTAFARRPRLAYQRAGRQTRAFVEYLRAEQIANHVPERQRISVVPIKGPTAPAIAAPRKKTLAVVVFMSMLILTCALILVVDNVSRRRAEAAGPVDAEVEPEGPRIVSPEREEKPSERERAVRGIASQRDEPVEQERVRAVRSTLHGGAPPNGGGADGAASELELRRTGSDKPHGRRSDG